MREFVNAWAQLSSLHLAITSTGITSLYSDLDPADGPPGSTADGERLRSALVCITTHVGLMSNLLLVASLAYRWSISVSTPLPPDPVLRFFSRSNTTASDAIPPQFDQRSVGDIVWGCLATVFACSWVAVHPNVPPSDSTWLQRSMIRFELMLWTILAPEVMVLWSAKQWLAARRVRDAYRDRGWTVTHGFFIQMGGFMLFDGKVEKGVLSPQRFGDLLEKGDIEFPDLTAEEIEDRSKGDGLSKGIVLVQTGWFIVQLAARVKENISVTQLELATSGFAAMNGFMYFFWWNKPLDIRFPIKIQLLYPTALTKDDIRFSNSDYASLKFRSSSPDLLGENLPQHDSQSLEGCLVRHGQSIFMGCGASCHLPVIDSDNQDNEQRIQDNHTALRKVTDTPSNIDGRLVRHGQNLSIAFDNVSQSSPSAEGVEVASQDIHDNDHLRNLTDPPHPPPERLISSKDLNTQKVQNTTDSFTHDDDTGRCLVRHGQCIFMALVDDSDICTFKLHPAVSDQLHSSPGARHSQDIVVTVKDSDDSSSVTTDSQIQSRLANAWESRFVLVDDEPDFELLDMPGVPMFFSAEIPRRGILYCSFISTSMGILFGAIHCAGWDLDFPSQVEAHLWRISSFIVLGYPTAFFLVLAPQLAVPGVKRIQGKWHEIGDMVMFFVFLPIYVGARMFILVEVFLALRKLPASASYDIQWTAFFPHI